MTKQDDAEPGTIPETASGGARPAVLAKKAIDLARRRLGRAALPARAMVATLGPLGAALWALYPVAIVLLVIGLLFAGAGST